MNVTLNQESSWVYEDLDLPSKRKFTLLVVWPETDDGEQIDVHAINETHAKKICMEALKQDYMPGGVIHDYEERHPGIMYF